VNNTYRILEGHWLDVAKEIPDASIQCVVTSVPYYGLRSYGTPPQVWLTPDQFSHQQHPEENFELGFYFSCEVHEWEPIKQYKDSWRRGERSAGHHSDVRNEVGANRIRSREELRDGRWTCTEYCLTCGAWRGELGQEPSPALYVNHLVQVFAEVWRVLRDDGTCWVNIGDAHYNYRPGKSASASDYKRVQGYERETKNGDRNLPPVGANRSYKIDGLKEKDLIGLPWMFAFAMREFGWYWRSEIHWHKPNPLSESVEDRPTKNHEPILMFTKSEKYFYDKWAITEPPSSNAHPRLAKNGNANLGNKKLSAESRNNDSWRLGTAGTICPGGRNKRTVWTMNVQGYPGDDHYAAFCEELPETVIKAGTSEVGCCAKCLAPWRRIVLKPAVKEHKDETLENRWRRSAADRGIDIDSAITGDSITLGWQRGCKCYDGAPVPCTVLDPFAGRGTSLAVAVRFGRSAVGAELQNKYIPMIRRNIEGESPLWVKEAS
jgi:DNA modification methylase